MKVNKKISDTLCRKSISNCVRLVSAVSGKENYNLRGLNCWRALPAVVPFQLTEKEAKEKFESWHKSHWFGPSYSFGIQDVEVFSAFMPFWCFEANVSFEYSTRPGFKTNKGEVMWSKKVVKDTVSEMLISSNSPHMQIYASFKHRRDLTEILKQSNFSELSRPLTVTEAKASRVQPDACGMAWTLEEPDMQQAMAWELALRALRKSKEKEVEDIVKSRTGADTFGDTHIKLKILHRKAQMVYYPAYLIRYSFSKSHAPSGEIVPDRFQAVLSGLSSGGVAGERHYSPLKVQLATLGLGLTACATSRALGVAFDSVMMIDTLFWTFILSMLSRLMARFSSKIKKFKHLQKIDDFDEKFQKSYFKDFSYVIGATTFTDYQDTLRCDAEWFQWEEVDKWEWNEEQRKKWGEMLWREQHKRRKKNCAQKEKIETEKVTRERDRIREEKRRIKWGDSIRNNGYYEREEMHYQQQRINGGTFKDKLGYYKLLGLSPDGKATEEDIKMAFKREALLWHPDLRVINCKTRDVGPREMHQKFQQIQIAYQTLRDPKQKQLYDSGHHSEAL